MAAVRRNIVTSPAARDAFVQAVLALKAEELGPTTADFGIPGPAARVSTFDLFVIWHQAAMMRMTPPTQGDRNAAHSGPVFLPWHRFMLLLFEVQMQRLLGNPDVGLPYWDWAADGDRPAAEQVGAPLWTDAGIGRSGSPVPDGPFRAGQFRVRIESGATARLRSTDRPLRRSLGVEAPALPTSAQVATTLAQTTYDAAPWNRASAGFRNRVEGWAPSPGPRTHNLVHVFVGGDMLPATSPNDPVFYLNHANVDRIWEGWLTRRGRTYVPSARQAGAPAGHRLDDALYSLLVQGTFTPAQMLDVAAFSTYDALP